MGKKDEDGVKRRKRGGQGNDKQVKETKEEKPKQDETNPYRELGRTVCASLLIRVVIFFYWTDWLRDRVELSTPLVDISRLREAFILQDETDNVYSGDRVHMVPIMINGLWFVRFLNDTSLFVLFAMLEMLSGLLLLWGTRAYLWEQGRNESESQQLALLILKGFLFNPLSISTTCSLSLAAIYLHMASWVIYGFFTRNLIASAVVSLWTSCSMYPLLILFPFLLRMKGRRVLTLTVFTVCFLVFTSLNFILQGGSSFVEHTYFFSLRVDDVMPNVGVMWYFFTEIFTHFRLFFLVLFKLNILVYIVPVNATLRNDSLIALLVSLCLIAVFVPYPSLSDAVPFLSLLPLIPSNVWKNVRYLLVESCTLATCVVLMPVMWHMWIISGSGNANFFFGATLFYNIALIQMAIDIMHGSLKTTLSEKCPKDVPSEKTLIMFH